MSAENICIDEIAATLGTAPRVGYAATSVYPWAAPAFRTSPHAERERIQGPKMRLYVHIHFCQYDCSYCFYAIRAGADRPLMERYVRALERELEWVERGTPLSQLFVGGGTPTSLPPDLLDRVLRAIFSRMPLYEHEVHTVETSPETLTDEQLCVLERRGIGRVSMGIQSFDETVLEAVHRRHSPTQALDACKLLVGRGMIANVDLIYGLPRQSEEGFRRDLDLVAGAGGGEGYQFGIGNSARSHLGLTVYRNHPRLETYLERIEQGVSPVEEIFPLDLDDRKTQFVARSLGDGKPLERAAYKSAFGVPIEDDFGELIGRLRSASLIEDDGPTLSLSETGKLVYDRITLSFYPKKAQAWLQARKPFERSGKSLR